jgi:hypothetical protein
MPSPALAAREPAGSDTTLSSRRAGSPTRRTLTTAVGDDARRGPEDRGADALTQAQRTVELLRGQVARLEAAIGNREFQAARWLAASLRTTAPGLRSSLDEARRRGADAAALAAVERRAVELSPRLEAALAQAPASARGLGFDLLDPEGEERLEQAWLAQLDAPSTAEAAGAAPSDAGRRTSARADHASPTAPRSSGVATPRGFELVPTATPAPTLRQRRDDMFAALDAMNARIHARAEVATQLGVHAAGRLDYSAHVLGKSLEVRRHEATAELAALRFAIAAGDVDGPRLERLVQRLDRLDFETTLIAQIASLGQLFSLLDELEDDRWVLLVEGLQGSDSDLPYYGETGGRIGQLEAMRRGASALKGGLGTLHSRWLKVQRLAQLVEHGEGAAATSNPPDATTSDGARAVSGAGAAAAAAGPFTGLVRHATARLLEDEVAGIRRLAASLGNDDAIRAFLQEAMRSARSAQTRAMIAQLAAMIGVAVLATTAAAATGGLAAGAGAGKVATFFVGAATESAVFTSLSAHLNGEGLGPKLLTDFGANLATFGALRAVRGFVAASRVGHVLAAGPAASGRGAYLAAKLTDFSASSLTVAASQLAISEAQSLAAHGRPLRSEERRVGKECRRLCRSRWSPYH